VVKDSQAGKDVRKLQGIFLDSPVQGLEYQTRTQSGITNEKGEFNYLEGETVTFLVGGFGAGDRSRESAGYSR